MGKASSSKKVARVAKAGQGTKVRSSQGQVFYLSLAVVAVLGLALIVFARQSGKENRVASPPTLTDHWHAAYGFYTCGTWQAPITNQADPLGIHTHGDGLIHIHPVSSEATGSNAKLKVFFKAAGVEMSNSKLTLPQGQGTFENGGDCNGKKANLRVAVWDEANGTGAPTIYTTDFGNIRFTGPNMAFTIAWVPDDVDLATLKPPSITALAAPGDLTTTTTVPGSIPVDSTVPGATTVPGGTTAPAPTSDPNAGTTTSG